MENPYHLQNVHCALPCSLEFRTQVTTDSLSVVKPLVLCVLEFYINGIIEYAVFYLASWAWDNVFEFSCCCIFFLVVHPVLLLNSIPMCVYITIWSSTHTVVDIWVVSSLRL